MSYLRVGVKYCGHCNPRVEGPELVEQIRKMDSEVAFVGWDHPEKDVLLIISGCTTDCVSKPEYSGPIVHVAGYSLGHKQILPGELSAAVLNAIREKEGKHG